MTKIQLTDVQIKTLQAVSYEIAIGLAIENSKFSGKDLLLGFIDDVENGNYPPVECIYVLADTFRKILEGTPADTALSLAKASGRPKLTLKQVEYTYEKVNSVMLMKNLSKTAAFEQIEGISPATAKRHYNHYLNILKNRKINSLSSNMYRRFLELSSHMDIKKAIGKFASDFNLKLSEAAAVIKIIEHENLNFKKIQENQSEQKQLPRTPFPYRVKK